MKVSMSSLGVAITIAIGISFFVIGLFVPLAIRAWSTGKIVTPNEMKTGNESIVAIVFGAGLIRDNQAPSDVLKDRLKTAYEAWGTGKVRAVIVSGDNSRPEYNEPRVMKKYLIDQGVPEDRIIEDFAGRSTYETCSRAKKIWKLKEAVLITQEFHLPRALFLCESQGIQSIGLSASRQKYIRASWFALREWLAMPKALLDAVMKPSAIPANNQEQMIP